MPRLPSLAFIVYGLALLVQPAAEGAASLITAPAPLSDAQIRTVLRGALDAQKGRYVTGSIVGDLQQPDRASSEYLLDADDGRIRFMRYSTEDPDVMEPTITVVEFTRHPAVRCTEGSPPPAGTLAITYHHWGGRWQRPRASVAVFMETLEPLTTILSAAPGELTDDGFDMVDGRRLRSFSRRINVPSALGPGTSVDTVRIAPETLLLARSAISFTYESKTLEVEGRWEYPPPKPIGRPAGVEPPNCI